jgi:sporulation protein YlmC with PRC-barrel domain
MIAAELRGGNKPSLNEALGWIGSRVDDIYGANVGRLDDVWIDPATGVPRWLLVNEGRFGGRTTLIPFEDATAGAGHVWVPYEREIVRAAPEIEPGAPLTHQVETSLRAHYASKLSPGSAERAAPARATATLRLHGAEGGADTAFAGERHVGHGAPAPEPPAPAQQPQGHGQPVGGAPPPYQLPARPAPPIAAPGPPSPDPGWQASGRQQQPAQAGWQPQEPSQEAWHQPPPPPPAQPPVQPAPDPIAALQDIAGSPGVHYVEIELAGELSIRGELRSVRVVPR